MINDYTNVFEDKQMVSLANFDILIDLLTFLNFTSLKKN